MFQTMYKASNINRHDVINFINDLVVGYSLSQEWNPKSHHLSEICLRGETDLGDVG